MQRLVRLQTAAPALRRQDSGMTGRDGFSAASSAQNDASPGGDDYQASPGDGDGDRAQAPSFRDGPSASRADFSPASSRNDPGRDDFGSDYDSDQALQDSDGGLSSSGPRQNSRDDVGVHTDSDGDDPDSASNALRGGTSDAANQDSPSVSAGTPGQGGMDSRDDPNLSDHELDTQRKSAGNDPSELSSRDADPDADPAAPNRAGEASPRDSMVGKMNPADVFRLQVMATPSITRAHSRPWAAPGTMISARTLKTQTPSRPGKETIPTVSTEKLVDLVHVVASLTISLQVEMVATTAMAGGKISTARISTADNKHRMLRSEIRKEASVAMATTAADRKTLAGTRTVLVGKVWGIPATAHRAPDRIRMTMARAGMVAPEIRQTITVVRDHTPAGTTTTGAVAVKVAGPTGTTTLAPEVHQTITVGRDHTPTGSDRAGTTTIGAAAVSGVTLQVSGPTGTMTMGARAVRLSGTRTREVSRLRLQLPLNTIANHRGSQGMMVGTTGRIVVGTIHRTTPQVGTATPGMMTTATMRTATTMTTATTTAATVDTTTTMTGDTTTVKALSGFLFCLKALTYALINSIASSPESFRRWRSRLPPASSPKRCRGRDRPR